VPPSSEVVDPIYRTCMLYSMPNFHYTPIYSVDNSRRIYGTMAPLVTIVRSYLHRALILHIITCIIEHVAQTLRWRQVSGHRPTGRERHRLRTPSGCRIRRTFTPERGSERLGTCRTIRSTRKRTVISHEVSLRSVGDVRRSC